MATLTEANIREAEIITALRSVPIANVEFVENTTISEDDDITIDDEYTSASATATEEIFAGEIGDTDYLDESNAFCESQLSEIDVITPNNVTYTSTYLNMLINLINDLCSVIVLPDAADCIGKYYGTGTWDFNDDIDGTDPDGFTVNTETNGDIYVEADLLGGHVYYCMLKKTAGAALSIIAERTITDDPSSGTLEFYIRADSGIVSSIPIRVEIQEDPTILGIIQIEVSAGGVYTLEMFHAATQTDMVLNADQWYHIRWDFECGAGGYKGLAADSQSIYVDGVIKVDDELFYSSNTADNADLVEISASDAVADNNGKSGYIDAIGFSWDTNYYIGKNLSYDQTFFKYPTSDNTYPIQVWVHDGEKTIRNLMDEYADSVGGHWFFDNAKAIYCGDCDTDSGFDITTSSDLIYITGQKQIKQIDKVILLGGWVSGIRLKVTSGAGNNVFKDTYTSVTDTNLLQSIADNILTNKQLHPVTLSVVILDAVKGMFQVGETITIGASLIFSDTTKAVPTGQYIIRQCIFNNLTKVCELILDDGIVFQGTKSLGEENSELIRQNRADFEDMMDESAAYSSSWNGDSEPASKDAVYDKIESLEGFVWRTSDPNVWDFDETTLTDDATENDMDLSSIIPTGVAGVLMRVKLQDNAVGSYVYFKNHGLTNAYAITIQRTQVANVVIELMALVGVNGDRKCTILCQPKPTDWTAIEIVVCGWWY
jgi:hypothetical protein